jgi:tetratricopeptide (TPR) repeat protein
MSEDLSRKELLEEPDPFLVFVGRMLEFGKKYQKEILGAIGAVVALAIVITGVVYYKNQTEDRAAVLLGKAMNKYNAVKKGDTAPAAYEEVKKEFKALADKYRSTGAGKAALLQYADLCYLTKNYDDAIAGYEKALDALGDTEFRTMILNGLAYAWEGKGDYEQAAGYFEKIIGEDTAVSKDQALFNLGRMYGKLGKTDKEKEMYARLVAEYPDSLFFDLASEKIAG